MHERGSQTRGVGDRDCGALLPCVPATACTRCIALRSSTHGRKADSLSPCVAPRTPLSSAPESSGVQLLTPWPARAVRCWWSIATRALAKGRPAPPLRSFDSTTRRWPGWRPLGRRTGPGWTGKGSSVAPTRTGRSRGSGERDPCASMRRPTIRPRCCGSSTRSGCPTRCSARRRSGGPTRGWIPRVTTHRSRSTATRSGMSRPERSAGTSRPTRGSSTIPRSPRTTWPRPPNGGACSSCSEPRCRGSGAGATGCPGSS